VTLQKTWDVLYSDQNMQCNLVPLAPPAEICLKWQRVAQTACLSVHKDCVTKSLAGSEISGWPFRGSSSTRSRIIIRMAVISCVCLRLFLDVAWCSERRASAPRSCTASCLRSGVSCLARNVITFYFSHNYFILIIVKHNVFERVFMLCADPSGRAV